MESVTLLKNRVQPCIQAERTPFHAPSESSDKTTQACREKPLFNMDENICSILEEVTKLLRNSMEAVSRCYEGAPAPFTCIEFRRKVYSEGWLYGEYIHGETLVVVKTILNLTEWRLMTGERNDTLPPHLLSSFGDMEPLLRTLKVKYGKVLERLRDIKQKQRVDNNGSESAIGHNIMKSPSVIQSVIGSGSGNSNSALVVTSTPSEGPGRTDGTHNTKIPPTNRAEIPPNEGKRRIKPQNPINLNFKMRNKSGEAYRRDLRLVELSLNALFDAIEGLSKLLDPAKAFMNTLISPGPRMTKSMQNEIPLSTIVSYCKQFLEAKLDQHITFYGIEEKINENYRERWKKEVMDTVSRRNVLYPIKG